MLPPMAAGLICWLRPALSLPPAIHSMTPPHEASAAEVQSHESSYLGRFSTPKRVLLPKGNQT